MHLIKQLKATSKVNEIFSTGKHTVIVVFSFVVFRTLLGQFIVTGGSTENELNCFVRKCTSAAVLIPALR